MFAATSARVEAASRRPVTRTRRSLHEVARFYGFPTVHATDSVFTCRSAYSQLLFEAGSRRLLFNGHLIYLNGSVGGPRDRWGIDVADADTVIDALLRPGRVAPRRPSRIVVLDPGHGGADLGAVGARNVQEKRVNLDIARRVRAKLDADPLTVYLTREGDYAVSLADRVERANKLRAGIFVSIHINAAHNKEITGVETFVLPAPGYPSTAQRSVQGSAGAALPGNDFDAANTLLGYLLHRELVAAARTPDRGLKRARFGVLKNIQCPAVLVECGFVSNPLEEERFLQPEYRDQLAEAIARGIRAFFARNR